MDTLLSDAKHLAKKLEEVSGLASMCQQMTNARLGEAQAIREAKAEIVNLKRSSRLKLKF